MLMSRSRLLLATAILVSTTTIAAAQAPKRGFGPVPVYPASVGPFDVTIVKRAAALLSSSAVWNRTDSGRCPRADTTYSVRCALQRAIVEAVGLAWDRGVVTKPTAKPAGAKLECTMEIATSRQGGSCGTLWDEAPVFILKRAPGVTSGSWRLNTKPLEVWAGTMADAESPVNFESRHGVDLVANRKASDQLIDFNNDSATTFTEVRAYFRALEDRVLKAGAQDIEKETDDVEIEIYKGGTGAMRTYNGWYPVSGFVVKGNTLRFELDTLAQIEPNATDREILLRASKILVADSVWNRNDNRQCPAGATQWSIYCAIEQAEVQVTGGFHHRRPAMELVRVLVEDRTKGKRYQHRLMDYNNDKATVLADVQSVFAEALAKIK
jgi:hypothetical protein